MTRFSMIIDQHGSFAFFLCSLIDFVRCNVCRRTEFLVMCKRVACYDKYIRKKFLEGIETSVKKTSPIIRILFS